MDPLLTVALGGCIWALRGCCLFFAVEETLKILAADPGTEKHYKRPAFWWVAFAFVMTWLF